MFPVRIPSTMRAAVQTTPGQPLEITTLPIPTLEHDRVLVRIHAAGLNPLDTKIRTGSAAHARHMLPAVLGIDMAGVVVAVGADVSRFAPGDRVFGMTGGVGGVQGALAEFAAVDPALLAVLPENACLRDAAALPLVFITAWEALIDRARVRQGQTVLIHGGAGGVGHVAIQIAKAQGAHVFATGRAAQADAIEGHGATFIDHQTQSVKDYLQLHTNGQGFDVVLDTVGGATLDASFAAVREYGGHVVSILGWGTHSLAPLSFRNGTYSGVFTLQPLITGRGRVHHGEILNEAARMLREGRLSVGIDAQRFLLDGAEAAYHYLEHGKARGKVVVDVHQR